MVIHLRRGMQDLNFLIEDINSPIYGFIEICYEQLGPKNMKLTIVEDKSYIGNKASYFLWETCSKDILNLMS